MSRSYWLPIIALGGCLSASALAQAPNTERVAAPSPAIENQRPNKPDTAPYPTESAPLPIRIIEKPEDSKRAEDREAKSDKHDAEDLDAQRRSATAAEEQVLPAWLGAALAGVGTILLVVNLFVLEADRRQTKRSAEAQLRAYVGVRSEGRPVIDGTHRFHGCITVTNNGATLAHNVRSNFRCEIHNKDEAERLVWEMSEPARRDRSLAPGASYSMPVCITNATGIPQVASKDQIDAVLGKLAQVRIWGWVKYTDAFDNDRVTYFHYIVGYFELRDGAYGLHSEGNSAT